MIPYASPPAATLVFVEHPFLPVTPRQAQRVELDGRAIMLADVVMPLVRSRPGHHMTVLVNGEYHLPTMGERVIQAGDIIVVTDEALGGGDGSLRMVLNIALTVALAVMTGGTSLAFQFGVQLVGHLALNALLNNLIPSSQPQGASAASPSPSYTFALSGNQMANQGEPIAVGYGWQRSYPKFAGQPYTEFDDSNNQYYYAVLEVGQGKYTIPRMEIDDTDIAHFTSVTTHVVNPGETLTIAQANVVTAPEVSGQDLNTGVRVGGFNACGPGSTATDIGIDIVLNGLGAQDGSGIGDKSVEIKVEVRPIDDFGRPTDVWSLIATETITAATTSQVRRSFKYTLASPIRPQVRLYRNDPKDERVGALNSPTWAGLRAYLAQPAPLASTATYVEVKAKASEQLNGLSQRRIAVFAMRKIKSWNPDTGWDLVELESRSIPWAIADALMNPIYGKGLPESRIDLQTFYDLDQIYQARQDHFDFVFDTDTTVDQMANLIARAGRAVCMPRGGVWTMMRDQQQTLPVAMYTPRTMVGEGGRSTFSMPFVLPTEETPDGVLLEYYDNVVWDWRHIVCPMPGLTALEVVKPVVERIYGVNGAKQAEREGLYMAADTFYRRSFPQWTSSLDGRLPAYGSLVLVAHDLPRWGSFGDVVDWDAASLTITLTETPDWTGGAHYIRLQRPDGTPHPAILCEEGPAANQAYLAAAPDFTPLFADAAKERTKYALGTATNNAMPCRVKSLVPRGMRRVAIGCVLEDDRVHTIDNALLPAEGEIQDPISVDPGSEGAGDLPIVSLSSHSITASTTEGTAASAGYEMHNDGSSLLFAVYLEFGGGAYEEHPPGEWLLAQPLTTTETALFEIKATQVSGDTLAAGSSALGVWLGGATDRSWWVETDGTVQSKSASLLIEVRDVATATLQDSATISLTAYTFHVDGG